MKNRKPTILVVSFLFVLFASDLAFAIMDPLENIDNIYIVYYVSFSSIMYLLLFSLHKPKRNSTYIVYVFVSSISLIIFNSIVFFGYVGARIEILMFLFLVFIITSWVYYGLRIRYSNKFITIILGIGHIFTRVLISYLLLLATLIGAMGV